MRRSIFYVLLLFSLSFSFITFSTGFQIASVKNSDSLDTLKKYSFARTKRELEDFEGDDYATPVAQQTDEEPSFWDRMVKIALKVFNKFIEWLNS